MRLDAFTQLCSAQQVTADAASENTFDAGNVTPKRKIGVGEPLGVGIFITAIGTNTGSAILQAIQSANADLSSPDIVGSMNLATGDIAAGKAYFVLYSPGSIAAKRYWGAYFDITGTVDFTVDAYIMPASLFAQLPASYDVGYLVS